MNPNDLKQFNQFRDLSAEELEQLISLLEERPYAKGRRVLREGEDAEGLLLVTEGLLSTQTEAGHEGKLEAPVALGAAALVSLGVRAMTAVAEEPCIVHVLTRTAFHRFAEDAPRAAVRILEAVITDMAGLLREGAAQS